jgi:hypothetical protein
MLSEEPDTPSGESPLRESLQHFGSMEDERDMHSGESPRPRYNLDPLPHHSNAYQIQGVISVQRELWKMDELREVQRRLSQRAARLFKSMCHTMKRS